MSEDLLGPSLGDTDEAAMRLYRRMVGPEADALAVQRAFAVFCGAAAACAVRFGDEADFGCPLAEPEREEWRALTHVLMRLTDAYAFGSTDGEIGEVARALRQAGEIFDAAGGAEEE